MPDLMIDILNYGHIYLFSAVLLMNNWNEQFSSISYDNLNLSGNMLIE